MPHFFFNTLFRKYCQDIRLPVNTIKGMLTSQKDCEIEAYLIIERFLILRRKLVDILSKLSLKGRCGRKYFLLIR